MQKHPPQYFETKNGILIIFYVLFVLKICFESALFICLSNNFDATLQEDNLENKTIMTERDYELRLKVLYTQLALIDKYEEEFIKKEGRRGVEAHRDEIFDEINHINRLLKKIRKT